MKPLVRASLINDPFDDPGLYLDFLFARRALLFDLGDLGPLSARKLLRVSHACVSHTHMDHFIGFDRLLRLMLARDRQLEIFGPPGFLDHVQNKLNSYSWNRVKGFPEALSVLAAEYHPEGYLHRAMFRCREAFRRHDLAKTPVEDGIIVREPDFVLRAAVLDHEIPCLGFAIEESRHVNILKNRLQDRGLAVGPWLADLKSAIRAAKPPETPIRAGFADGHLREMRLGDLADVTRVSAGQKIAYVTDVRYHRKNRDSIVALARHADRLFIEAVFLDEDAELARNRNHLTAAQAGALAAAAGVRDYTIFHFSPRYKSRANDIHQEAAAGFQGAHQSGIARRH